MNPKFLVGAAAFALVSGGIGFSKAPTPEEVEQMRLERERRVAEETTARRAASPDVAKAEAKRERRRQKLLRQQEPHNG